MASVALGAAGSALAGSAGLTTATGALTFGGSLLAGSFAIGGSIVDSYLTSALLSGGNDGTKFQTDYGSVRASQGDELTPVPRVLGEHNRVPGLPIWSSPARARRTVDNRRGKRGEDSQTVELSWLQSVSQAFAANDCQTIRRVLVDGQNVYDTRPDIFVQVKANDDAAGDGALFNSSRYLVNDYIPGGILLYQASLWHMVVESYPSFEDEFAIAGITFVPDPGITALGASFSRTRIQLSAVHGLARGQRIQLRTDASVIVGRDFGGAFVSSEPSPEEGHFYWGVVPDVSGFETLIDIPINETQRVAGVNINVTYEPTGTEKVYLDRRLGRAAPTASAFLGQFDVGKPIIFENVTRGIVWNDPGFECVVSRSLGNNIDQCILDLNVGFTGTGQIFSPRPYIDHYLDKQNDVPGTYSVTSATPVAANNGQLPFLIDKGDVISLTQERSPDDDFAEQWEFPGIDSGDIETQAASLVMSGELSGEELPFFRGLNFAAIENINTSGSGSRLGNFEFFPVEEAQKALSDALQDICTDWDVSGQFNTGTLVMPGMAWSGRIEATQLLEQLSVAWDLVAKEEEYGEIRFDRRLETTTWDFDSRELNPDGQDVLIPDDEGNRISFVGEDISTRPTEITVGFFDIEDNLNRGAITERLATIDKGADEQSVSLSISMTSDKAREIGRRLIRQFHNWVAVDFRLPDSFNFIRENDQILITVRETVETLGVESDYARRLRILVAKVDEGADGVLRCEGRVTSFDKAVDGFSEDSGDASNTVELTDVFGDSFRDTKRNTAAVLDNARPSWNVQVFDGPAFHSADEGKTGYYIAAAPLDDQAQLLGAVAYKSVDSGATWESLGDVPMATMGFLDGNPLLAAADVPGADTEALKPYVEVYGGQTLRTETATGLTLGRNRALVGVGDTAEVIQFTNATEVERGRYKLETITRALLGTEAVAHPAPDPFVLLDDSIPFFEVPREEMGLTHEIRVVPVGKTLDDVRSVSIDVPAFVEPLTPKDQHYTFSSTDLSGTALNTVAFKHQGEVYSASTQEIVIPRDFTLEKLTYDIRALAGGASDMVFVIKDGATTLWTSPAITPVTLDYATHNTGVLDISGVTISAGDKFFIELSSPTTGVATWAINAGVVGTWNS